MRTTVTIDDADFEAALKMAEPGTDKATLVREAIRTFIRVRAAQRLAALGGSSPGMADIPRRGSLPEHETSPSA